MNRKQDSVELASNFQAETQICCWDIVPASIFNERAISQGALSRIIFNTGSKICDSRWYYITEYFYVSNKRGDSLNRLPTVIFLVLFREGF